MTDLDTLDHERYMTRACELAREAVESGNEPYGSLLVNDGEIIMEERNRVNTESDFAFHPELTLARRAPQELDPQTVSETVMYTSTEPCAMCSTGMTYAGLKAVVYSVSGSKAAELRGDGIGGIPSEEVFERYGADTTVIGPVLPEEGADIHRSFDHG